MQQENPRAGSNELILSPGEFAHVQDNTKGTIQTFVGPIVVTQTGQLRAVIFSDNRFHETRLEDTRIPCVSALKGEYLVLHNPTVDNDGLIHPSAGTNNTSVPDLSHGEKIVVPGPVEFALWPQQSATKIKGHHLQPDQYLLVRVYDEDAAVANWNDAVIATAEDSAEDTIANKTATELGLTLGRLLLIKDVSFYIPPTGIEVIPDDGEYVRDALTLEMGEYAILVDQSGKKRYEHGPQIVFPAPTEEFLEDKSGNTKFKPIELTPTQGLHIKINCDYIDKEWPNGEGSTITREFSEGDEIFITGETHPIYYPREEHSIIRYGDNLVHFATAVSAGQARYVMDKDTGVIETRNGPAMILLNPIHEVFVTRVLSDAESLLMYPGNQDSLDYNRELRSFQTSRGEPSTNNSILAADFQNFGAQSLCSTRAKSAAAPTALPDVIRRSTTYTKPHSVTLDDRFTGAPTLRVWTGFAVLIVKADGSRRTVVGPRVTTLDFDETVSPLHLSTGKPKTTDNLITTGYLEVKNNKVSDIVTVDTSDGITFKVKLSYRVSFTGDSEKWFDIDNYVKFLTDHIRSRLTGIARNHTVNEFHQNTVSIVRDAVLGPKLNDEPREGLLFPENGMHVTDVEILDVTISNQEVADLLLNQQQEVVTNRIQIERAAQDLQVQLEKEKVARASLLAIDETRQVHHKIELAILDSEATLGKKKSDEALVRAQENIALAEAVQSEANVSHTSSLQRQTDMANLEGAVEKARTDNIIARFEAANGDLAAAIRELGDKATLEKVAQAVGPMRLIGDASITDVIAELFGAAGTNSKFIQRLTNLVNTDD